MIKVSFGYEQLSLLLYTLGDKKQQSGQKNTTQHNTKQPNEKIYFTLQFLDVACRWLRLINFRCSISRGMNVWFGICTVTKTSKNNETFAR